MSWTLGDAWLYLRGDTSDLEQKLDGAEKKTKSFSSSLGSMAQGAMMGVGMAAVNMVAGVAQSTIAFVGDSVTAASDMGETISKVNTLFGDSATGILAWSETSSTAFGLSKQAALDAAGGLGNMFMQLGAGTEQAGDVSQDMVQLAADLASFHNAAGGTNEVLDTMSAAFRGEYDAVQRFIPTINAAAVELKAMEMTGKTSAKELTNLEKALAVQAIMMEDAGAATGDFARTSGGLANQQRILDAQMSNLKATVGEALLPVMLGFTSMLNNLVQTVLPPLATFIRERVVPVMAQFGDMFGVLQGWFATFKGSLDTDVSAPLQYWQEWLNTNLPMIQTLFQNVLNAIQGFWALFGEDIMTVVGNTFDTVWTIIDTTMRTIGDLITLALQLITGDWEGAGTTLEGIVTRIWETIKTVVGNQLDSLKTLFTSIDWGAVGSAIIEGVKSGISSGWQALLQWFPDRLSELRNMLPFSEPKDSSSPLRNLGKSGKALIDNFKSGMDEELANLNASFAGGLAGLAGNLGSQPAAAAGAMNITVQVSGANATYESGRAVGRGIQDELRRRGA